MMNWLSVTASLGDMFIGVCQYKYHIDTHTPNKYSEVCTFDFDRAVFGSLYKVNRIQGKYKLENKKISDRERVYEFLRRIPKRRTYNSLPYRESQFKWKVNIQSSWQQRDRHHHTIIAHHSKIDANAGGWTSVCTLTRMGCNPYANYFSEVEPCVFERFVIFAICENYLANYVQKLR